MNVWVYYNPSPSGRNVGDCSVRARHSARLRSGQCSADRKAKCRHYSVSKGRDLRLEICTLVLPGQTLFYSDLTGIRVH